MRWLGERGPSGLRSLVAPQAFAADPFLYDAGDGTVCLFEALDYDSNRGWIAAVDVPPDGPDPAERPPRQRTVFQNEWHWSYPFVLTDGGDTYCIPETADAGGVLLHRLTPSGFEQEADLLPGLPVLDPTIVRHEGRYWLFCTLRDGPLLNTALHLFVADRLTGPYRPHRHNPVKLDVRSARPAGTIFAIDGVLHRPGQDCGRRVRRGARHPSHRRAVGGRLSRDGRRRAAAERAVRRRPPHAVVRWRLGRDRRQAPCVQPSPARRAAQEGRRRRS